MKREANQMSEPTTSIPSKAPSLVELADALDNGGMIGYTRAFVQDFRQGLNHVSLERFDWMNQLTNKKWAGILCLGMGGSAAGGEFLSALTSFQGTIPVQVQRDYTLPAWWNPTWLIVATSHSGNTEETLEATETGLKSGATVVVISTGGILAGLPELYTNCYLVPSIGGQPPRSAFGHIFSRQLGLLRHLGVLPMPHDGADEAMLQRLQKAMDGFDLLNDPEGDIAQLAMCMVERPIALLGPTELTPVLNRFKNQLNENSARFARVGIVPEMNHNESVAWGGVGDDRDASGIDHVLLLLTWKGMHNRVQRRMDWMIAHAATDYAWKIEGEGATLLESMLHLCILTDWISLALSFLHGKDPASIGPIFALKDHLNSVE